MPEFEYEDFQNELVQATQPFSGFDEPQPENMRYYIGRDGLWYLTFNYQSKKPDWVIVSEESALAYQLKAEQMKTQRVAMYGWDKLHREEWD